MAVTPARVVLFLVGLVLAAGLYAFGSGALGPENADPKLASIPAIPQEPATAPTDNQPAAGATSPSANQPAANATQPAPSDAAGAQPNPTGNATPAAPAGVSPNTNEPAPAAAAATATPSFDILRVEPDGSAVVAGRATPGTTVEIVSGTKVVGKAIASAGGDFAVALDDPLASGDHTLVLRQVGENGVATSAETAIVSVPQNKNGEVLAMVEEPGQPSRLITIPDAPNARSELPNAGSQAPNEQNTGSAAEQPAVNAASPEPRPADAPQVTSSAQSTPNEATTPAAKPSAVETAPAVTAVEPSTNPAAPASQAPASSTPVEETTPAAKPSAVETAPVATAVEPSTNPVALALQAPASSTPVEETTPAVVNPADPVAAAEAPGNAAAPATDTAETPSVEAVEIEGDMVFVAGRGAPGSKLRVYATDVFLGEATASPAGQFLVEADRALPVGQYTIRVDAIGADQKTVTARAAVPFEREPGEVVGAVAPVAAESSVASPAQVAPAQTTSVPATPSATAQTNVPGAIAPMPEAKSAAATPEQTTAPALQRADGAVIIRRGDSLWRISKRAYGRGVRYSTIYLANQDQIQNPDRIWPGQIFRMPESTEEGEKADMTQLGEQATTRE